MPRARPTAKQQIEERRREYGAKFFPYIERVARRLARRLPAHVDVDELISAGTIGLLEAADRYDPKRADRFEAFAEFRIRGAMLDHLRHTDTLSRDMRRLSNELRAATLAVEGRLGRAPAPAEVAAELGMELEAFFAAQQKLSGSSVVGIDDAGPDFLERTADLAATDPVEAAEHREALAYLAELIAEMPARPRRVLSLYYLEDLTLKEIGDLLGVTESRICQIHGEAITALRAELLLLLPAN